MLVKVLIVGAGRPIDLSYHLLYSLWHWLNPISKKAVQSIVNFQIFALCYEIFAVK